MEDLSYFTIVIVCCSGISLLGSLFNILAYLLTPGLDALLNRQVFILAISDFLMSLGFLMTFWTYDLPYDDKSPLCITQALLLSFTRKTGIIVSFTIYYSIYLVITELYPTLSSQLSMQGFVEEVEDVKKDLKEKIKKMSIIGIVFSALVTPLPLITEDYGHIENAWCFIVIKENYYLDTLWMTTQFQGVYVIFIVVCLYFNYKIHMSIRVSNDSNGQAVVCKTVQNRLIWYPIVVILFYFPIFLNRILIKYFFPFDDVELSRCIVGGVCALTGFVNMIVFGINGGIFEKMCDSGEEEEMSEAFLKEN